MNNENCKLLPSQIDALRCTSKIEYKSVVPKCFCAFILNFAKKEKLKENKSAKTVVNH